MSKDAIPSSRTSVFSLRHCR